MLWVVSAVAAAGWTAMLVVALLWRRQQSAQREICLSLHRHVEPYLLRMANELGITASPLEHDDAIRPEVLSEQLCYVARLLTDSDRKRIAHADTMNMATSDTVPLDVTKLPVE